MDLKLFGKKLSPAQVTLMFLIIFVAAGALYYLFIKITGFAVPCILYSMSGLKCPTCGITRMVLHILSFEFAEAFRDNAFVFLTWPFSVGEILYLIYMSAAKKEISKKNYIFVAVLVGIALIFCIIRNTDIFLNIQ